MGLFSKLVLLLFTISTIYLGILFHDLCQTKPTPVLPSTWWGPGSPGKDDTAIKPFNINISEEVLVDLKDRLNKARPFVPPLEGAQHHYGFNTDLLKEIVDFWRTKYDWRQREKYLNKFPQYKTQIQGLDIHYIHVKPENKKNLRVVPLLISHGWPGSIREFYELIPMLMQPQPNTDFVFELIVPSLPGYGFSQAASKQGMGSPQIAVIFKNLMERLGFKKFYVQGGDWGSSIITYMGAMFGDRVLGMHCNMCVVGSPLANIKMFLGSFAPSLIVDKKFESKMYPLSKHFGLTLLESGYLHIQATKPDTVGVGLNDSPVGLAAYILEKFIAGTNMEWKDRADGGLKSKFKYENLLDNVMIYWVTNSMTTAMRLYAESLNSKQNAFSDRVQVDVPTACAKFPNEITYQPDSMLKEKYTNLVQSTDMDEGGHFAAFEMPKLLADDIWSAIRKMEALREK